jgi:hypothetical protein
MDPYLEGSLWSSVHAALSVEIARQLSPQLRPKYVALIEKRYVLDVPPEVRSDEGVVISAGTWEATGVQPDVSVALSSGRTQDSPSRTAVVDPPLRMATVMPEAIPLHTVEIRDVAQRRLVTVIEVLSPTNKAGDGRVEYIQRRQKYLRSDVHLMEIDLLRRGQRVPMVGRLPDKPYFVFLSRSGGRPVTDIWPVDLAERLPAVPVPLLAGDADVSLNIQAALNSIYDQLGFDLAVDYSKPPEVVAGPETDEEWIEQTARSAARA